MLIVVCIKVAVSVEEMISASKACLRNAKKDCESISCTWSLDRLLSTDLRSYEFSLVLSRVRVLPYMKTAPTGRSLTDFVPHAFMT